MKNVIDFEVQVGSNLLVDVKRIWLSFFKHVNVQYVYVFMFESTIVIERRLRIDGVCRGATIWNTKPYR